MPTARAIHCKSGLAPANTLRAFRFYPYCFASAAATHIVQAAHANAKTKAYPKSVAAPVR
ncbi:MAG: hypothetical protein HOP08_14685 [Cyclobacteriaceae bacterium]|nr:hypothetical protein [Cyclobacteriaceae bacterium]